MKVFFVGHAGFFIDTNAGGILVDPWLEGRAFGNSWELLEPSVLPGHVWQRVKFLWFSHEHPDHFHLHSLSLIPEMEAARLRSEGPTAQSLKLTSLVPLSSRKNQES